MLTAILICFGFAILFLFPRKNSGYWVLQLSPLLPASLFFYFILLINRADQSDLNEFTSWIPDMGIHFSFYLDGLSALFVFLICGIGTLVYLYSVSYMKNHPHLNRFFSYLTLFMGSMLGLVLSDNLITLFIFWELTSISSFFLIGFNHKDPDARKAALTALAITGGGGLLLLLSFILMGSVTGTNEISAIIQSPDLLKESRVLPAIILLLLGGAFTKSAQLPFHFWLPDAMKAPTPISTYLHSATMVKAGIYLLARFSPAMNGEFLWNEVLLVVGALTMLYGAFNSVFKTDLKAILAYTTISSLGIMTMLIGVGTPLAIMALGSFILIHALYKAGLFLVTGAIDKMEKTRNLLQLGGLIKNRKYLFIAGLLAAASGAGIIPALGYHGKHLVYESLFKQEDSLSQILLLTALFSNIFLICASFLVGVRPFTGVVKNPTPGKKSTPALMVWPPMILGFVGLLAGVFPVFFELHILLPLQYSLTGLSMEPSFHLWHGLGFLAILGWVTLAAGLIFYLKLKPSYRYRKSFSKFKKVSSRYLLHEIIMGIKRLFWLITHLLQNGYLRYYTAVILSFLILLILFRMYAGFEISFNPISGGPISFLEGTTIFIMFITIGLAMVTDSRVVSVAALGGVGLGICLLFLYFSAPDLAMTQFTIDTLTVVLFVLLLRKLPLYLLKVDQGINYKDLLISGSFGAIITLVALEVMANGSGKEISQFYAENAYTLAKGKNVVNVILVDFRGMDTLIEITVLAVAGLGIFSLIRLKMNVD